MINRNIFQIGAAALLALSLPAAAYAQAEGGMSVIEPTPEVDGMAVEKLDPFAMIAKIFGGKENTTPIDPTQLALAEKTTAKLLPQGTLKKIMGKMFETFVDPMLNALPEMSSYEIMSETGFTEDQIGSLDEEQRKKITAIFDPTRKERGKQAIEVLTPLLDETMALLEAPMRTGLSRAYARKFSGDQLTKINSFFATPAGSAYATESYVLQSDPEIIQSMLKEMPAAFETLKTKVPPLEQEIKNLPKARTFAELNEEELARLAGLLKVDSALLIAQRDAMSKRAVEEAIDLVAADDAASNPFSDETGSEPWYEEANWASADRTKAKAASAKHEKAEAKAAKTSSAWISITDNAIAKSRDKYKAQGWRPEPVTEADAATDAAAAAAEAADAAKAAAEAAAQAI